MRRTVTLLVVATSLLMVVPVGASEARPAPGPAALPAAPAVVQTPAAPAPDPAGAPPPVAAPVVVQAPAAPTSAAPAPHSIKAVRAKVLRRAAALTDLTDAAYAAHLQAELCRARQIFCGLDRGGRYPGR